MASKWLPIDQVLDKIRTPSESLNLAGCGGIAFGGLVELWGDSKAGKSTFAYQTAKMFLEQYGDRAVVGILPAEGVPNKLRLKRVFGIDIDRDDRVWMSPAFTIEMANDTINRWSAEIKADGKVGLFIVDTISTMSFKAEYDAIQNSIHGGGEEVDEETGEVKEGKKKGKSGPAERGANAPMMKAAILKWHMTQALAATYDAAITILYINQVTSKMNQFSVSRTSSGGYALKHNANERFRFHFDEKTGGDLSAKGKDWHYGGTMSEIEVEKSRFIPLLKVPMVIDDKAGGIIDPNEELILMGLKIGMIGKKNGGWLFVHPQFIPTASKKELEDKSFQRPDLAKNQAVLDAIRRGLAGYFRSEFQLVNWAYEEYEELKVARDNTAPKKKK